METQAHAMHAEGVGGPLGVGWPMDAVGLGFTPHARQQLQQLQPLQSNVGVSVESLDDICCIGEGAARRKPRLRDTQLDSDDSFDEQELAEPARRAGVADEARRFEARVKGGVKRQVDESKRLVIPEPSSPQRAHSPSRPPSTKTSLSGSKQAQQQQQQPSLVQVRVDDTCSTSSARECNSELCQKLTVRGM